VLVVHYDIVHAIDDSHVAALALLDLSSAFDSVDRSTVLVYQSYDPGSPSSRSY